MVSFVAEVASQHPQVSSPVGHLARGRRRAVVAEGATLLNDAWAPTIHNWRRSPPNTAWAWSVHPTRVGWPQDPPHRVAYPDVMAAVVDDVVGQARRAVELGVSSSSILIDPGHDFGKNTRHSLECTRRLPRWSPPGGRSWSR